MDQERSHKTYKYKLRPTPQQAAELMRVVACCRILYNTALEQRKTWWGRGQGKSPTYYQQQNELPDLKEAFPELKQVHSQVLQDTLRRVDASFQHFFRRVQAHETPGYPRFQGQERYHSFTYPQYGNGVTIDGQIVSLSKIGRVPFTCHRPLRGTPKTVTISHEADGWYVCFSCADAPAQPLSLTGKMTGIDVGIKVFLITADGLVVENPRHYWKAEKQLAKAQRRVSRRKKGSKRCTKAKAQLAKKHQKVKRQRQDSHHKAALLLVKQYDVIYCEAIQPANLSRRPKPQPDPDHPGKYLRNRARAKAGLNKSILDASWSQFLRILTFKAAWAGKRAEAIPPAFTTQDCSNVLPTGRICGERVPKSLSVRTHICPSCGFIADRDENAAMNILRLGQSRQTLTWSDGASVV